MARSGGQVLAIHSETRLKCVDMLVPGGYDTENRKKN
jgi:hypothetical protein